MVSIWPDNWPGKGLQRADQIIKELKREWMNSLPKNNSTIFPPKNNKRKQEPCTQSSQMEYGTRKERLREQQMRMANVYVAKTKMLDYNIFGGNAQP
eukprot:15052703-Heterocapsa_arctica.AAC.1